MPFEKIDAKQKIEERINTDPEFVKEYYATAKEYDIISKVIKARRLLGYTQKALADLVNLFKKSYIAFQSKLDNFKFLQLTQADAVK